MLVLVGALGVILVFWYPYGDLFSFCRIFGAHLYQGLETSHTQMLHRDARFGVWVEREHLYQNSAGPVSGEKLQLPSVRREPSATEVEDSL